MTAFPRIVALGAAVAALASSGTTVASAQSVADDVQPSVLSVERYETPVDGWNGWLVWSRRGPDGRYSLIARNPSGQGFMFPLAPQPVPIDASIGPGPDGRPLIVYSQCVKPGVQPTGCDVYSLDPVSGNNGRVTVAARANREERYPTVWGNKIAFSLSVGKGPSRTGVAIADLTSATPVTRPTVFGPRTERIAGKTIPLRKYGPRGIDLRNGRLAFSWQGQGRSDRWSLHLADTKKGSTRQLLSERTTSAVVSQIGRPALGLVDVVVPVLRTGGESTSEIVRTTFSGRQRWKLQGGFSSEQTERYGSAQTAVARTDDRDLVVVRRLASDGRWACVAPASNDPGGCELLRYADASRAWVSMRKSPGTSAAPASASTRS